jgi:type III secretory pathway component EscU
VFFYAADEEFPPTSWCIYGLSLLMCVFAPIMYVLLLVSIFDLWCFSTETRTRKMHMSKRQRNISYASKHEEKEILGPSRMIVGKTRHSRNSDRRDVELEVRSSFQIKQFRDSKTENQTPR